LAKTWKLYLGENGAMIKLQGKLPREIYVACSGGIDSMAVVDFLKRNHSVRILHYHHGTAHGDKAMKFMLKYCGENDIDLLYEQNKETIPPGLSREAFWREKRYAFFDRFDDAPIITAHHLDDCVETWVWSSMHGNPKIIPYRRRNVIRPFRLNRKRDFKLWLDLKNVPYIEDESNEDLHYTRNFIRHEMMPSVLKVNEGIHKTIKKKIKAEDDTNRDI